MRIFLACIFAPASAAPPGGSRAEFLQITARGYFPGRSGQIVIVPKHGHIMTRDDPEVPFMHGSPWPYDTAIPMMFIRPMVLRSGSPRSRSAS